DEIQRIERSSPQGVKLIRQKWEEKRVADEASVRDMAEKNEYEPKQAGMDKQGGHVMVETLLNKKVKASLILDTGASFILLSGNIAKNLGIDADPRGGDTVEVMLADGSKVKAKRIILESVSVQGSEVKRVEAAILPQNESGAAIGDGLLGMSFLNKFNFKIDQKNNKLILEKL
ncbi:TIGR02281 family clan AA aspartic protease, partial [bacterium]